MRTTTTAPCPRPSTRPSDLLRELPRNPQPEPHRTRHRTPPGATSGQALVEFALVVPILLILVLGVIDFGRAWHAYQVITDAAREGARLAVVARTPSATPTTVEGAVRDALTRRNLPSGSRTTAVTVGLVQPAPPAAPLVWPGDAGDQVAVRVDQNFNFLFVGPLLRWAAGRETVTLSTTSVMRKEW